MGTSQSVADGDNPPTPMQESTTFQIMSDLHLEFGKGYKKFQIPPSAPHLCLLGDIGRTVDERLFPFLERQLTAFKVVFFLLGNHEAYGSSYTASKARLQTFHEHCQQQRAADSDLGEFVVLDKTRYDVSDQVTVLGCTLYSHVLPEQQDNVGARLNDFYEIGEWTVAAHNAAHRSDVEWLRHELAVLSEEEPSRRVIVMTHHSPTMVSDPRYRDSPLTSAFSTDLVPREFDASQICVWAFGHTHYNSDFTAGRVRLFSNQRGYVHDLSAGFDVGKVISL
jgi:Calcineurin-like phosphoesterase